MDAVAGLVGGLAAVPCRPRTAAPGPEGSWDTVQGLLETGLSAEIEHVKRSRENQPP